MGEDPVKSPLELQYASATMNVARLHLIAAAAKTQNMHRWAWSMQ